MARGWESKSVEQQQRILQQMEVASNPRHRGMLKAALADLDAQLEKQ